MSSDDFYWAKRPSGPAASLRLKRRICLITMWLALIIAIAALAERSNVPMLGTVALISWLVFAVSIAYLEGLSGSGGFNVGVVFLISLSCPPLVGLPVAWMVNGRVKARIRLLDEESLNT